MKLQPEQSMPSFHYVITAAAPPGTILDRLRREVGSPSEEPFDFATKRAFTPYPAPPLPKLSRFYGYVDASSFEIWRARAWVKLHGRILSAGDGSRIIVSVTAWPALMTIAGLVISFCASNSTVEYYFSLPPHWAIDPGLNLVFLALIIPVLVVTFVGSVKASNELNTVVGLAMAERKLQIDVELS